VSTNCAIAAPEGAGDTVVVLPTEVGSLESVKLRTHLDIEKKASMITQTMSVALMVFSMNSASLTVRGESIILSYDKIELVVAEKVDKLLCFLFKMRAKSI